MLHYNHLWINFDWLPIGVFSLLASQALTLSRRAALAFRRATELAHQARLFTAAQWAEEAAAMVETEPREAEALINSVRALVERVCDEEIRDASHRLHPAAIRAGLIGALESLCARWHEVVTAKFSVDAKLAELDDPGGPRLKESLRLGLYRIVEEAFHNIHRHAKARQLPRPYNR